MTDTDVDELVADATRGLDMPVALAEHLEIVGNSAGIVLNGLAERFPQLELDAQAILFGARTHDIGKAIHPQELRTPGSLHEEAGYEWLRSRGFPERLARFARSHGSRHVETLSIEELLVVLADKLWKARRVEALEAEIIARVVDACDAESWQVFDVLDAIADAAHVGVSTG